MTGSKAERYANAHSESDKKDILVNCVPECQHDNYLKRFIRCLRKSVKEAGAAHEELADLLEEEYNKTERSGFPLSEPDTGLCNSF